jgi:hypothetical protein
MKELIAKLQTLDPEAIVWRDFGGVLARYEEAGEPQVRTKTEWKLNYTFAEYEDDDVIVII